MQKTPEKGQTPHFPDFIKKLECYYIFLNFFIFGIFDYKNYEFLDLMHSGNKL